VDLLPLDTSHDAQSIRALRGAVTRDEAIHALAGGVAGRARRIALGPLRSVADVYVPFRLYRVTVRRGATVERSVLGLDAVGGALDLYRFDREPGPDDVTVVHTQNHVEALLTDAAVRDLAASRLKRMVYRRIGFLVAGRVRIELDAIGGDLYVPYWAGFFGRGEAARIVVMDAIRRQIEGAKVRRLICRWLLR
jgi:hypothetical protein